MFFWNLIWHPKRATRWRLGLDTMVGENFEIFWSEMAGNWLKLSIKNGRKLSTVVGEMCEMYLSEMAKNGLKLLKL